LSPSTSSPHHNISKPASRGRQESLTNKCEEKSSSCPSDSQNLAQAVTKDPKLVSGCSEADHLGGSSVRRFETIPSTYPAEEVDLRDVDGDQYWAAFDDFPYDAFDQVDFDAVDNVNVETNIAASQSPDKAA